MSEPLLYIDGVRVLDLTRVLAGPLSAQMLADLGAEVIKIERPGGGDDARAFGPPYLKDPEGKANNNNSFYLCANRNKKSVVLDLRETLAREHLLRLLEGADVLLDASCGALNEALRIDRAALSGRFPSLVTARMTPFGDDGPWKDLKSSDLIHLALGGIMMNCGYDPDPNLEYDTPPIAPQIWHAYHIAGDGPVARLVAHIARVMTLEPGDLIATGTPEGVGPLAAGDEVTVAIAGIGRLVNRVVKEGDRPGAGPGR